MKWIDTIRIAEEPHDKFMELEGFDDDPNHSGEKILEAIQMAWIDEAK